MKRIIPRFQWPSRWSQQLQKLPIAFFLICTLVFFAFGNSSKPRVLVLDSYATDFAWTKDINVGLNWVLEKKPYSIQYHYMDTKRNPGQSYKEKAGQLARRLIERWEPNVVIAVDDNAQAFVAKYFNNNPKINTVYTGVNAEASLYGYDTASNVTGILERIPFTSLKEIFLQILPVDQRRIVHYSDDSETSDAIHAEMEEFDWRPIKLIEHRKVATFEEWKKFILNSGDIADFLLITHYHTLRRSATDDAVVPPKEVMKWTVENSPIPDIGCWGFYVDDGGMLAVGISPYEMGEVAAKMTVDIIDNNRLPHDIPTTKSQNFVMYMRESRLKKYGVDLPKVYKDFAHATNHYYQ
jgi:ABC-type uncharacterized transport system substrate-binding protein